MGRRLRALFGPLTKKIIDALSALTVDKGRPYDVSRSALLEELAALPQPLAACYPAKKQAQYFINITNSTLSHATMSIASTSFFVDDSVTADSLVVLHGLTNGGNKWRIEIKKGRTRRDGRQTYLASVEVAKKTFEDRVITGPRPA